MIRGGEKSNNTGSGKVNSGEENGYLSLFLISPDWTVLVEVRDIDFHFIGVKYNINLKSL